MNGLLRLALVPVLCLPARALFGPNVRVDHENRPGHGCYHADITVAGPDVVCVAFQRDSFVGIVAVREDVLFQRSNDGGVSWKETDILVRRGTAFACYPDIATDGRGNLYVVYTERASGSEGHLYCTRSTDFGETWLTRSRIDDNPAAVPLGWGRIACDTAGALFTAWNDKRTGRMRIYSSVSTDFGATWSASVRVDDDTVPSDCFHADVSVQPGTNDYLVTSSYPYWVRPGYISSHAMMTRSTDQGRSFTPCTVLDTFHGGYCGQPHIVADAEHIIADYSGNSSGNQNRTQARTSSDGGGTWTSPVDVTELDTLYSSYLNGGKLALDPQGFVHVSLMVCDIATWDYEIYYARSTDLGRSWSEREIVNDVLDGTKSDPNIAADSAGFAFVVWQDGRNSRDEIWFAGNRLAGIAATPAIRSQPVVRCRPSHFRERTTITLSGLPAQSRNPVLSVHDAIGRLVRTLPVSCSPPCSPYSLLWDGADRAGQRCPPGVYMISVRWDERLPSDLQKVVLLAR